MRSAPPAVIGVLALLGLWLGVYQLDVVVGFAPTEGWLFGKPVTLVISFAAAATCAAAGFFRHRGADRFAWLTIAAAIACWNAGDTYWSAVLLDQESIPVPSWADAGYLAFPVLVFIGFGALMRPSVDVGSRLLLVDGLAAGLAVGAVAAAAIVGDVLSDAGGVAVNLAYPVSDLVLLGLVVGAVAARGWRLDRTWALLGTAIIVFWTADTNYLVTLADGSYDFPEVADIGWTLCFLLMATAAWQPSVRSAPGARLGRRATLLPLGFAALALGVLAEAGYTGGSRPAVVVAVASLLAVGVRLLVTFTAHVEMLESSQEEALTDPLTGLGNRRRLLAQLRAAVARATPEHPEVLVLFDLDGFKHYNDSFGHPAGDALLTLLGQRLADEAGPGACAYRMGGDEFCLLAPLADRGVDDVCRAGARALSDAGSGFAIGASHGAVVLPRDAEDAEEALRVADQRMYAHKHGGRASASRQVSDVLVTALVERDGDLGEHVRDVALLASGVAEELGLSPQERELVRQAAVLHDVGKVAIPDAILEKPGPLDDAEWVFMRRHTIVGERIIGAAPALLGVAEIVRGSHERWDGQGYPDGLAGEEIPLGSRIVAVCDAYDAMTTSRPYSTARPDPEVLVELQRCSGTQFDPAVVTAFCRRLAASRLEAVTA